MKAHYYVELLAVDSLTCMSDIEEFLPVFKDITYHCRKASAYYLGVNIWMALGLALIMLWKY